jgi:hypothetical protein
MPLNEKDKDWIREEIKNAHKTKFGKVARFTFPPLGSMFTDGCRRCPRTETYGSGDQG